MGYRVTTLNVNAIEPAGSTLTIGASGDTVVATDSVNVNTVKDAGGNTLWVSNGSGTLSSVSSGFGDALKLISTTTISASSSTVDITSGIDNTYEAYLFKLYRIIVSTGDKIFGFQVNASGQSGFNEPITSTHFQAQHNEANNYATLNYVTAADQTDGTDYQTTFAGLNGVSTAADECANGWLYLFNPSDTTYVKNFYATISSNNAGNSNDPSAWNGFTAGRIETTSAITEISFKMSSGTIDGGIIKMYGVA